jgi:hypothetical protein
VLAYFADAIGDERRVVGGVDAERVELQRIHVRRQRSLTMRHGRHVDDARGCRHLLKLKLSNGGKTVNANQLVRVDVTLKAKKQIERSIEKDRDM